MLYIRLKQQLLRTAATTSELNIELGLLKVNMNTVYVVTDYYGEVILTATTDEKAAIEVWLESDELRCNISKWVDGVKDTNYKPV